MRWFLLLLLASPCLAAGPKYKYSDPHLDDEIQNIYHDLRTLLTGDVRISSVTISSATINSRLAYDPSVISYKVGTFSKPVGTGNQSVTGVGFKPRMVVFFSGFGSANSGRSGFGVMTATDQASGGGILSENADWGGDNTSGAKAYSEYDAASTATYVSMDSDGFTINWGAINATITTIAYIAFR